MNRTLLFWLIAIALIALKSTDFIPNHAIQWCVGGTAAIAIFILLYLLYRSYILPLKAAERGMEILNSQSFNNRLRPVGEPHADRIVALFNRLSGHLREESIRLREQDTLLAKIIELSPVGIIMLDLQDRVSTGNQAFASLCGIPLDEIMGKDINTIPSELIPILLSLKDGEERVFHTPNGERLRCYSMHFMSNGFRRRFFHVESLSEEIRKAEKNAYEKVIRMIAHEVNNSMGGVNTVLQTISDDPSFDSDIRQLADSTMQRCASMSEFITSFADLARIPEPTMTKIHLRDELQSLLPFLSTMASPIAEIQLLPSDDITINGDISLLQQCIVNIVKNGIEAIAERQASDPQFKEPGLIEIALSSSPQSVNLTITNNGTPISSENALSLFSPFFSTKRTGRGIGLTLVAEVLHRHSARYSLRTLPSSLTTFSITFPGA